MENWYHVPKCRGLDNSMRQQKNKESSITGEGRFQETFE